MHTYLNLCAKYIIQLNAVDNAIVNICVKLKNLSLRYINVKMFYC